MPYNPTIHHRRSIRLKGYDYSQAGLYFVTICVKDRLHLFGKIENAKMILNDAGKMVERWYYELENKYPDKQCYEMVVMPNHFHCIIENIADIAESNAHDAEKGDNDLQMVAHDAEKGAHVGAPLRGRPFDDEPTYGKNNQKYNATIGDAIDWFKTMTTNEYIRGVKNNGWERFNQKLWQRDYWEHIIRDEKAYQTISNYILENPEKWRGDKFF